MQEPQATNPAPSQPLILDYATPAPPPVNLQKIAQRQHDLSWFALLYAFISIALVALTIVGIDSPSIQLPEAWAALYLTFFCSTVVFAILTCICACLLCVTVYRGAAGPLMMLLTITTAFIPIVGLMACLLIHWQASRILRRHGLKVGLIRSGLRELPMA